jgi:two-component system, chemotaxis family, CheB/CheR fusion protein
MASKKPGKKKAPGPSMPGSSFPIVCIGASAGGLEAFTRLLEGLPKETGMGFVVIQHLDPNHPSALPPLLAKKSTLPVTEAKNGMRVKKDHVYVLPPDAIMTISRGTLKLSTRTSQGRFMPIDHFMRSLAEELKSSAIGVILSGTATDGTLGLEGIKAEGGLTFAQDEKTAQYPGMPASAINSGCVDFVLPPAEIARELVKVSRHPFVLRPAAAGLENWGAPGSDNQFNKIFELLRKVTGLDFSSYKRTTIQRRIARRMTLHKFTSMGEYIAFLQKLRSEVEALSQDLLIKVTTFFRDTEAFDTLRKKIFPALLKQRRPADPIRIWVPGCSTGEEVYSIGMTLIESLDDSAPDLTCQIFATDISESAIEKARNGFYAENIKQDVTPERLRRFFVKTAEGYRITKAVRDMCIFARQDLTKDPPFSKLDLISCRNVLIYMGSDLQKRIIPIFHYALKPNGYLMLGSAESTGSFSNLFTLADKKGKVYGKKQVAGDLRVGYPGLVPSPPKAASAAKKAVKHEAPGSELDLFKETDKLILTRYTPAGVLLNDELEILQYRGHTGPYLEQAPGKPSVNILKLVREGMVYELKSAADRALKQGVAIQTSPISMRTNGQHRDVVIDVVPIHSTMSDKPFLLVMFSDVPPAKAKTAQGQAKLTQKTEAKLVNQLRRELNAVREELQSVIEEQEAAQEEFKSANEEILSSNEELQSTNEELETAKEELQSANEELTTLNEELLTRNSELGLLNSDITNLLSSISIPILMLSQDLRIRRFTPVAGSLLNLIPGDVGRPITDINPNIDLPGLDKMVSEVLDSMAVQEKDVRAKDGRWFSLRVRPYRTLDNKIDGAIVMFLDIEGLKKAQQALAIVETIRHPLLVLDSGLHVASANPAFLRLFRTNEQETVGKPIYELDGGQWNIPALRELLEEILPKKTTVEDFKVEHTFSRLGHRSLMINARRLAEHGEDPLILVAFEFADYAGGGRITKPSPTNPA